MDIPESVLNNLIPLVAIVGGLLFSLSVIWLGHWRHVQVTKQQVELKMALLAKGMSPEEIAKVVTAGQGKSC
jgi:hypothetical protein